LEFVAEDAHNFLQDEFRDGDSNLPTPRQIEDLVRQAAKVEREM